MFAPLLTTRGDCRHIVFADELSGPRRAINFAPAPVRRGRAAGQALAPAERRFVQWLFARAGMDASSYRDESLSRRLPACLRALHVDSPEQARALIEAYPVLLQPAIDAMIIGVTSFFRDDQVFTALADEVLPALLEANGRIRVWSAGSSDGAELYSIAMLLDELSQLEQSELLGTDCRRSAVECAAEGVFGASAIAGLSADRLERFFIRMPDAAHWWISPRLRVATRWSAADVLSADPPAPCHLVLCRNLAMYLRGPALTTLWEKLDQALVPGGYLVLGKAERPGLGMQYAPVADCVFRKSWGAA